MPEDTASNEASEVDIEANNRSSDSGSRPSSSLSDLNGLMRGVAEAVLTFFGLHPLPSFPYKELKEPIPGIVHFLFKYRVFLPYLPMFTKPGWVVQYVNGVTNPNTRWNTLEMILSDVIAGVTVGLMLIPQGLSYATLALLPPVNGLYAAILPSAVYSFFGCSMQLAVGPVAITSLLTGGLISKYGIDYLTQQEQAADLAAQASMA